MPSWEQIGRDYAAEVRAAVAQDQRQDLVYIKKAYAREQVTPGSLPGTSLVVALKKIARDLDTFWKVDDKPLTQEQKDRMLRETGAALGLAAPDDFVWLTKSCSNDNYVQMVGYIGALLQAAGKK